MSNPINFHEHHEEADSLITFHMSQSKGNLIVRGTDTDILIILLGMLGNYGEEDE